MPRPASDTNMSAGHGSRAVRWPPSTAGFPVPGQKLGDAIDRMGGDTGEHVAQIGLGIEAEHLAGLNNREIAAARSPPVSEAAAGGRIACSAALLVISSRSWVAQRSEPTTAKSSTGSLWPGYLCR